jgi:amino acid transporter
MAFAAPRVLVVLARDGHLPARWAGAEGRAPRTAALVSAAAAILLVVAFDFRGLVDVASVVVNMQYAATCVVVVLLRHGRRKGGPRPAIRVPVGTAIAALGLVFLAVLTAQATRLELAAAAGIMLFGELVAVLYRRKTAVGVSS